MPSRKRGRAHGRLPLPESCLAGGQLPFVLVSVRNNLTFPLKAFRGAGPLKPDIHASSWRKERVRSGRAQCKQEVGEQST